jgi:hypothetical protein
MTRFFYIIILLILFKTNIFAQVNIDWVRSISGNNEDYISKIVLDKDSNVIGIGTFQDSLSSLVSHGLNDVMVFKYDDSGDLIWLIQLGSISEDWGNDIAIDSTGNIYVTGYYKSTFYYNNDSIFNCGNADAFVAKIDSLGIIHWVKGIGHSGNDIGNAIIVDNDEKVYVSGTFQDSLTIDSQQLLSYSTYNNYLIQLDSSGQLLWHNTISTATANNIQDIELDANGDIYLLGYFRDVVYGTLGQLFSFGNNDILLAKFSSGGQLLWWKKMGGGSVDLGIALHISNNYLYLSGVFQDTAYFDSMTQVCDGEFDAFLAQCDMQGTVNWIQIVGGTDNSKGFDIATSANGNIYMVGLFEGTGRWGTDSATSRLPRHVPSDIFIAEYKTDGSYQSIKTIGSAGTDYATGICILDSTNIYIAGIFNDTVFFDSTLLISSGTDAFICKSSKLQPLAVAVNKPNISGTVIYPNPVSENTTIEFELEQSATIDIVLFNALGQPVKTMLRNQYCTGFQQIKFNKEYLSEGIYFIMIVSPNQKVVLPLAIH